MKLDSNYRNRSQPEAAQYLGVGITRFAGLDLRKPGTASDAHPRLLQQWRLFIESQNQVLDTVLSMLPFASSREKGSHLLGLL